MEEKLQKLTIYMINRIFSQMKLITGAYLEFNQTSKMERFEKIVNGF